MPTNPDTTDNATGKFSRYEEGLDPRDISVRLSELLIATSDEADHLIPGSIQEVLKMVRDKLNMDVVFVSEFVDGQRVVRQAECRGDPPELCAGQADPLEATWCQRIVDGRLPQIMNNVPLLAQTISIPPTDLKIGAHLATPIVLSNGRIYGTFCCFSARVDEELVERDLKNLQLAAKFTAEKLDKLKP
jgi:GAF domain-containing protein